MHEIQERVEEVAKLSNWLNNHSDLYKFGGLSSSRGIYVGNTTLPVAYQFHLVL